MRAHVWMGPQRIHLVLSCPQLFNFGVDGVLLGVHALQQERQGLQELREDGKTGAWLEVCPESWEDFGWIKSVVNKNETIEFLLILFLHTSKKRIGCLSRLDQQVGADSADVSVSGGSYFSVIQNLVVDFE